MIKRGQAITLSNDIRYLVLSKVKYQDNYYLYLISMEKEPKAVICEEKDNKVVIVKDDEILKNVILLFDKDIKEIL
ncbi:MAG: hypothetical protein VZS44_06890 [Bacilli bacterium]|nr:hypothetical protein [Bacilli bacterium]